MTWQPADFLVAGQASNWRPALAEIRPGFMRRVEFVPVLLT